jgi:hypothetical protein
MTVYRQRERTSSSLYSQRNNTVCAPAYIDHDAPLPAELVRLIEDPEKCDPETGTRWMVVVRDGAGLCAPGSGETLLRRRTH